MGGKVAVGVGAHVRAIFLLDGFGKREPVGGNDGAALDVARLGDGVVVAGHVLILRRLEHLDIGDVANEHGKQGGEQQYCAGEAVGKGHAAQQAALGRIEPGRRTWDPRAVTR